MSREAFRRSTFLRIVLFAGLVLFQLRRSHSVGERPGECAGCLQRRRRQIRLLANPAGTNSFIPFVMKKYKLDAKYGFELQVVPAVNPQAMLTAVQAGGAEIGNVFWSDIARWRNAGVKVVGISPMLAWADFAVVPASSSIRTLADLKGKKLGVTSRNSLNFVVMRAVAQRNFGFDLEKEVVVHEGSVSLLRGLLEQGQLDASEMYNSLAPAMFASGKFRPLAQIRELIVQLGLPDAPFRPGGARPELCDGASGQRARFPRRIPRDHRDPQGG